MGLGLDAGGTRTRWALAAANGVVVGQGEAEAFSALQMADPAGRAAIAAVLSHIAGESRRDARIEQLCAGVTGFDPENGTALAGGLEGLMATAFALPAARIELRSDIELACRCAFEPGAGCVLYAGTGSIIGFVDATGSFHRAGGRGVLLDDAGGGHWIALQALRAVWRAEDARPGSLRESVLGRALCTRIGSDSWAGHRERIHAMSRGQIGLLALAVAEAAPDDESARGILRAAGIELARLAQAMAARFGPQPIALAGRVFDLSPLVEQALRAALPPETALHRIEFAAHEAAARRAANTAAHTINATQ